MARRKARLGKMYVYHQPGHGGLPLGLASTERLDLCVRTLKRNIVIELCFGG